MNKPEREGFVDDAEPIESAAAEPEKPAEPQPDIWPLVIKLMHKPIQKSPMGDTVNELKFREPTAADIIRSGGNPVRIEAADLVGNQVHYNVKIDDAKMMRMMANLSGILEPYIQKMDSRDYNSCAYRLQRFFMSEQGWW